MKLAQGRSYMVEFTKVKSNASSSILYSLLFCNLTLREAIHETVAIVQPTCDKRMDKSY